MDLMAVLESSVRAARQSRGEDAGAEDATVHELRGTKRTAGEVEGRGQDGCREEDRCGEEDRGGRRTGREEDRCEVHRRDSRREEDGPEGRGEVHREEGRGEEDRLEVHREEGPCEEDGPYPQVRLSPALPGAPGRSIVGVVGLWLGCVRDTGRLSVFRTISHVGAREESKGRADMGRLVPAVTRALDILELFLDGDGTLSAPEITRRLQLPRTTVHELVTTLAARSLPGAAGRPARTLPAGGARATSSAAATPSSSTWPPRASRWPGASPRPVTRPSTWRSSRARDVIYIAKVDSTHAVRMVSAAGPPAARALHLRGQDAARLAARGGARGAPVGRRAADRDDARQHHLPRRAARGAAPGRGRGVAVESRESNPDVSCVAAPVRDSGGQVVAALSISVPMIRWSEERRGELEGLAAKGAARAVGPAGARGQG